MKLQQALLSKDWKIKKLGEVCEKIFAVGVKPKNFLNL